MARDNNYKTLRRVVENIYEGIIVTDSKDEIVFVNNQAARLSKKTKTDLLGTNISRDIIDHSAKFIRPYYNEAKRNLKSLYIKSIPVDSNNGKENLKSIELIPMVKDKNFNGMMCIIEDVTFFSEYEKQIAISQNYLDIAAVIIVILDKKGKVTLINRRGSELLEYKKSEMIGRSWFDNFIPRKKSKDLKAKFRKFISGEWKFPETYENIVLTKSGNERIISWKNAVIKDDNGNITASLSSGEDITEKKVAEEKLKESEEKYRLLVENQADLIVKLDPEWNYIFVSPSCCEFYNRTELEILGKKFLKFVHTKDRLEVTNSLKMLARSPNKSITEQRVKTKNRIRWIEWSNRATIDKKGKIATIICVGRDITEKKAMELKLKADEKRFRMLAENATDIVFRLKIKPLVVFEYLSPSIEKLSGHTPREIYNNPEIIFNIAHPEDRHLIQELIGSSKGFSKPFEIRWINKDGKTIWTEQNVSPIYNTEKEIIAFDGIARDITERKIAEEKIKYLSFHDSMTDLYNRAYFEEELKRLNTQRQLPLSFIMGDVNSLKLINDTFGHKEGDALLRNVATLMKSFCRKEDIISRWGGDEFAILLPQTPKDYASEIVERIREACSKTSRHKIPISISLGLASKEKEEQDINAIISEAEDNMYKSKLLEKKSISSSIISSLTKTLFDKSFETEKHTTRMREMAVEVGKTFGLSQSELDNLSLLATLHDIGKIAISDELLIKKAKLTRREWDIVKRHPEIGFSICESSPQLAHIADIVLAHHEWYDGSGYPQGLIGKEIPIESRIIAIIDAYDVMTNNQPYREAVSKNEALEELKKNAGSQFDPDIVEKLVNTINQEHGPDPKSITKGF